MKLAIIDWKGKFSAMPYLSIFRSRGIEYLYSESIEDLYLFS